MSKPQKKKKISSSLKMLKENITVEMTGMRVAIKLAGITSEMKEKILETKRKPLYPDSYPNNSQKRSENHQYKQRRLTMKTASTQ